MGSEQSHNCWEIGPEADPCEECLERAAVEDLLSEAIESALVGPRVRLERGQVRSYFNSLPRDLDAPDMIKERARLRDGFCKDMNQAISDIYEMADSGSEIDG